MHVNSFRAKGIHGFLDLDVSFKERITFLTGINGSGKTSVVNGLSALLSPALDYLAETSYREMSVDLSTEDGDLSISASRSEDMLRLKTNRDSAVLEVPILGRVLLPGHSRPSERELDYYRETEARNTAHPVLKRLKALPTPMSLGLDRRASLFALGESRDLPFVARRRQHNAFAGTLHRSLLEAGALAEQAYNAVQARLRDLTDDLRKRFILSALEYGDARSRGNKGGLKVDNAARIRIALRELGLTDDELARHFDTFLAKLNGIARFQPFDENIDEVLSGTDQEKKAAYLEWYTNAPQFSRLLRLLHRVEKYLAESQATSRDIDRYLETVNRFLGDSGKRLGFSRSGMLTATLRNRSERPVTALSSGESQIVVILTHLAFNPEALNENVFIVDEPELSLHLKWQELFVAAIQALNPTIQTILATHSPSIILEEIDACVDLTPINQ